MDRHELFDLTAPCGLDCFNCELLAARRTDALACRGCRIEGGCKLLDAPCPTHACVIERGVAFCSQCDDFPCARLMPARDGADRYPHNIKLFNLCRIQAVGLQRWGEEEASHVRERYYHGILRPGYGPCLDGDAPPCGGTIPGAGR